MFVTRVFNSDQLHRTLQSRPQDELVNRKRLSIRERSHQKRFSLPRSHTASRTKKRTNTEHQPQLIMVIPHEFMICDVRYKHRKKRWSLQRMFYFGLGSFLQQTLLVALQDRTGANLEPPAGRCRPLFSFVPATQRIPIKFISEGRAFAPLPFPPWNRPGSAS